MQKGFALISLVILAALISVAFFIKLPQQTNKSPVIPQAVVYKKPVADLNLNKYLTVETALLGISDNVSLYFKDLSTDQEITIDPSRSWIPASTIKAFVVLEAFRQKNLGLIDFNQEVTIKAQNVVPTELETDEFPRLREGTKATIKQLVEAMIIQSDNTAYNSLLDILDRRNINLALKNIGITETVVGEKLNLDANQFKTDLQIPGRQPNTTSVKDLATFFDILYNKKVESADAILDIFKRQKINNMIPALLPNDIVVAHKTGDWAPIYHDGGIIYKPDDPFILTIFTNSDNPQDIAELAKVAYFQNAASVGKTVSLNETPSQQSASRIYLSEAPENPAVLAAESPKKFPEISASDLGITQKDINSNPKQAKDLWEALIIPNSLFYKVKKFFENVQIKNAKNNFSLVETYLNLSKNRLSEVKVLIGSKDFKTADASLKESETDLEKATELAKNDPNKDLLLLEIKKVNDLHFAVLADRAQNVDDNNKQQFIDEVYNFYQQNHQKVTPVINTSVVANPAQQKPAVGTITEVKENQATLQFDDGSKKDMFLPQDTKVRNFQEDTYSSVTTIHKGDKVAVVGLSNSDAKIIPQFILRNVPKELPQEHQGTVIEIKPDENTMKILDNKGEEEIIRVNFSTTIKSSDTNVSLEGIKAGSEVTVFGTYNTPSMTSTPQQNSSTKYSDNPSSNNNSLPSQSSNTIQLIPGATSGSTKSEPANNANKTTIVKPIGVQATSVTVTQNASGKNEKVELKKEGSNKTPAPPKKTEPARLETKPQDKKK